MRTAHYTEIENGHGEFHTTERVEDLRHQRSEDLALIAVGGGTLTLAALLGGKMVGAACIVSLLTVGSAAILWIKTPSKIFDTAPGQLVTRYLPISQEKKQKLRNWDWKEAAERRELLIDAVASLAALAVFGTTITGLIAGGLTALGISVMFRVVKVSKRVMAQVKHQHMQACA